MNNKKQSLDLFTMIAILYCLGFGSYTLWRGLYWVVKSEVAAHESALYATLNNVFNLSIWGIPFTLSGILIILSSINLPYYKTKRVFHATFITGHVIAMAFYYIFTLASFEKAVNLLIPAQSLTLAVLSGAMAFVGGVDVWLQKTKMK
ncbi:hypothetical protein [Staphylococcus simiae]|uniref:Uncharacterized protein n=1 Tax=Staphylococcus simiae CCM 7213 = CCUG 51256 TaxID=911238 RepID=G5JHA2_9STAP|nr:hypothetical protein [Staphylococcus simiae]EHJ08450.1 hypothetical protein SS7213T_04155 [Staphylococcus simiae CCM 7213 = CCUG 51256]PNZ12553.1 hypothetical protein CD113_06575 [Staphylococcus simiae]SNV67517.1 hypothetical phage membrane protein [Staphylococcus simiae]